MAAAKYTVTAPAITVTVEGRLRQVFQGEPLPGGVSKAHIEALVDLKFLHETGSDEAAFANARGVGGTGSALAAELAAAAADDEDGDVEIPDGEPSEEWSGKALKGYAAAHNVDLGSAKTKAEFVAAIKSAPAA